jgi:uncharacterized protein (TIGR00369 family)
VVSSWFKLGAESIKSRPSVRCPHAANDGMQGTSMMETDLTPRPASASRVSLSIVIMPDQANPYGSLHGGVLLRLADECGAIAALRHVGHGQITTAAMDSMTFLGPVFVGERVELFAEVTYAGRTSIVSRIDIFAEPLEKAEPRKVGVGYALYVALDDQGKHPQRVPPLVSETETDRRRDEAATARQAVRLARRAEAKAQADQIH